MLEKINELLQEVFRPPQEGGLYDRNWESLGRAVGALTLRVPEAGPSTRAFIAFNDRVAMYIHEGARWFVTAAEIDPGTNPLQEPYPGEAARAVSPADLMRVLQEVRGLVSEIRSSV